MQVVQLATSTQYYSIHALSGYAVGKSLLITNNTSDPIFLVQSTTQPAINAPAHPLLPSETVLVQGSAQAIWALGDTGPIIVQDYSGTIIPCGQVDPRVYAGLQAFTVQSFTEANCKNGTQYELATYEPTLGAGVNRDFVVITGDNPILIKNRVFQFTGSLITVTIYRSPTYTGGTPATYYNLSDINPVPGTAQIIALPTVSNVGTQVSPSTTILGNIPQTGQAIVASNAENSVQGLERVLRPNTTYLFRTTNPTLAAMAYATKSTWYEGGLSVRQV